MRDMINLPTTGTLLGAVAWLTFNAVAAEIQVPQEYPTIQEAVDNAASGDTILLAGGDYYEQFTIAALTNVTIIGEPGTVLHAFDQMTVPPPPFQGVGYPIAAVVEGAEATFRNLDFRGHRLSDFYAESLMGIVFRGGSGRVEDCTLSGFRGESDKESRAINVQNELGASPGIVQIAVSNSTFSDNKASILLFGDGSLPSELRTRFTLESNNIRGAENILSTGIAIRPGVEGSLRGNVIVGHSADLGVVANDPEYSSRGFFHPLKKIVCSENVFSNNAVHFSAIAAKDIIVTNNIFAAKAPGLRDWAVTITGTNIVLAGNNFADSLVGVALPANEMLGGVSRGGVFNVEIHDNWFSSVQLPVSTNSFVSEMNEVGSQTCCFSPVFKAMSRATDEQIRISVRSWHGQPFYIETSTDLKEWTSGDSIVPVLPQVSIESPTHSGRTAEFFRTRSGD